MKQRLALFLLRPMLSSSIISRSCDTLPLGIQSGWFKDDAGLRRCLLLRRDFHLKAISLPREMCKELSFSLRDSVILPRDGSPFLSFFPFHEWSELSRDGLRAFVSIPGHRPHSGISACMRACFFKVVRRMRDDPPLPTFRTNFRTVSGYQMLSFSGSGVSLLSRLGRWPSRVTDLVAPPSSSRSLLPFAGFI